MLLVPPPVWFLVAIGDPDKEIGYSAIGSLLVAELVALC
jgi:hypothetical protein